MTQTIYLEFANQDFDIEQNFIDEIYYELKSKYLLKVLCLIHKDNQIEMAKNIMYIINSFLDFVSKNENNLLEFSDIKLIKKYNEYFSKYNIKLLYNNLDEYSKNKLNIEFNFFDKDLYEITNDFHILNFIYYNMINHKFLDKIYKKSKNDKNEYKKYLKKYTNTIIKLLTTYKTLSNKKNKIYNYFKSIAKFL